MNPSCLNTCMITRVATAISRALSKNISGFCERSAYLNAVIQSTVYLYQIVCIHFVCRYSVLYRKCDRYVGILSTVVTRDDELIFSGVRGFCSLLVYKKNYRNLKMSDKKRIYLSVYAKRKLKKEAEDAVSKLRLII